MSLLPNSSDRDAAPSIWRAPLEFARHAIVGTILFVIVALPAIALDFVTQLLHAHQVGLEVLLGLRLAEYAVFASDLFLFGVFLWKAASRTVRHL